MIREEDLKKELEIAIQGKDFQTSCAKRLGINYSSFKKLLHRARIHGVDAVLHSNMPNEYTDEFKLNVVNSVVSEGMPFETAGVKYNIGHSLVQTWVEKYKEGGSELLLSDGRGRKMGRRPKPKLEDYEVGSLGYYKLKSEQLERENLLLKKALPLVRDALRNRSKGKSNTGSSEN